MNQNHIDAIRVLRSKYPLIEIGFSLVGSESSPGFEPSDTFLCGITSHAPEANLAIGYGTSCDSPEDARERALTEALQLAGVMNADGTATTDQVVFVEPLNHDSKLPKELTQEPGKPPGGSVSSPSAPSSTAATEQTASSSASLTSEKLPRAYIDKLWGTAKIQGWGNHDVLDLVSLYGNVDNPKPPVILVTQLSVEQAEEIMDHMIHNAPPPPPS